MLASAQAKPKDANPPTAQQAKKPDSALDDYSGMYSFLREGEFLQINIHRAVVISTQPDAADQQSPDQELYSQKRASEEVTGFISRYGDLESDRGAFLDQFIDKGRLDHNRLTFTTRPLHGIWYHFEGIVERGKAKTSNEEGYYVLRGTLTEYKRDADKQSQAQSREVEFKSFPQDVSNATPHKRD